jgi:hypothetical protein
MLQGKEFGGTCSSDGMERYRLAPDKGQTGYAEAGLRAASSRSLAATKLPTAFGL